MQGTGYSNKDCTSEVIFSLLMSIAKPSMDRWALLFTAKQALKTNHVIYPLLFDHESMKQGIIVMR